MEGAKAFILPGVAALVLVAYYVWTSTAGPEATPPEPSPSAPAKTPTPNPGPATKAPDPSASDCEAQQAKARSAKLSRDSTTVLEVTLDRACWSSPELKLERQRLRVEAYAETDDLARCIEEGKTSDDAAIQKQVAWCKRMSDQPRDTAHSEPPLDRPDRPASP